MRKLIKILLALLVIIGGHYSFWRYQLSDDVARVEKSIAYHNEQFRIHNRWITLKADSVSPAGFPFKSFVRVKRPTLTFVFNQETYGASFPYADLKPRNSNEGSYDVTYPPVEAVFAKDGQAPEEYGVSTQTPPKVILRAMADSSKCSPFPGRDKCAAVKVDDPLISFAVQVPASLTITITLNGESKDVHFATMPIDIPLYRKIPADMDRNLELFVNILREAMVFQKNKDFSGGTPN